MTAEPFDAFLAQVEALPAHRSFSIFEGFALRLLEREAARQRKPIKFEGGGPGLASRRQFDAIAPEGIDGAKGSTVVEVKLFRRRPPEWSRRLRELSQLLADTGTDVVANVLLIHNGEGGPPAEAVADAGLPNVISWDREKLRALARKHRTAVPQGDELAFFVEDELTRSEDDWRMQSELAMDELRRVFTREQATLFLGAGVSIAAGVPAWNDLLGNLYLLLAARRFEGSVGSDADIIELASAARELGGGSPLIATRALRRGLRDAEHESFVDDLSRILYRDMRPTRGPLVQAISSLCQPQRTGARVRSVVTFNFDDLLETELAARNIRHRSIYLGDDQATVDELPLYHVHGFLPRDRAQYPRLDQAQLAFSEEGYHAFYGQPFHWTNTVQLHALRESTCVFIGLSMTDPNLRRLLEVAATSGKPRHFAFLKRVSEKDLRDTARDRGVKLKAALPGIGPLLRLHHRVTEEVLREFDIRPVWYEDHPELPARLSSLVAPA